MIEVDDEFARQIEQDYYAQTMKKFGAEIGLAMAAATIRAGARVLVRFYGPAAAAEAVYREADLIVAEAAAQLAAPPSLSGRLRGRLWGGKRCP
jgi:hypothetical protein